VPIDQDKSKSSLNTKVAIGEGVSLPQIDGTGSHPTHLTPSKNHTVMKKEASGFNSSATKHQEITPRGGQHASHREESVGTILTEEVKNQGMEKGKTTKVNFAKN